MNAHYINSTDSFIAGWYFEDTSICDKLIDHFNSSPLKAKGAVGRDGQRVVNNEYKSCTEIHLIDRVLASEYVSQLLVATSKYKEKYPWCDYYGPWGIVEPANIQYYQPGEAFFGWHSERVDNSPIGGSRHLVYMTYLNDVSDGGETEWFHQKIKIKPEKGLTVIWPADWTFTHRGVASATQEKYIATGWYNYQSPKVGP
jgi:prolyl 4-hydroxylase